MTDLQEQEQRINKINSYWNSIANRNFLCATIPDIEDLPLLKHITYLSNVPISLSINDNGIVVMRTDLIIEHKKRKKHDHKR